MTLQYVNKTELNQRIRKFIWSKMSLFVNEGGLKIYNMTISLPSEHKIKL